ncbi:hypothetical protein [Ancrocorticia populi]|uniref:Uncharacterized protein n=1 Tax=Ancrocorticia populi TaxID=2175228 RepID=A0A2V1K9V8_9ACTO|nr:hypothetical protein [Ancrocorticia populi]PWF27265.1 hypothetical protein DD236_02400 [Ancrocorticia populi]
MFKRINDLFGHGFFSLAGGIVFAAGLTYAVLSGVTQSINGSVRAGLILAVVGIALLLIGVARTHLGGRPTSRSHDTK